MDPTSDAENPSPPDGRRERSERSREAIVNALLSLIREGQLIPTAEQVATRANVGVRTVFRHFEDMDNLLASIDQRVKSEVSKLFVPDAQSGPLEERITALADRRSDFFERVAPFVRATALLRWRSDFVQEQHHSLVKILRRDLRRWLPELDTAKRDFAEAVEVCVSFECWNRLRTDQRLSAKRVAQTLERMLRSLLLD